MTAEQSKEGGVLVLAPAGRLDSTNAKSFEEQLTGVIGGGETKVLVDLSSLDYISSAGLRALLIGAKRMKEAGGSLAFCSLNDGVQEVFTTSGFSNILNVLSGKEEALVSLG